MSKSNAQYKKEARALKRLGLLGVKVDLRRKDFDAKQKRAITNAAKKHSHFIEARSRKSVKRFKSVYVPSGATRNNYRDHGYYVEGKHVILDVDNYDSVKPQKSIQLPGGKRKQIPGGVLKRRRGKKITYEFLASGENLQNLISNVDDYIDDLPDNRNIQVAGKFGDNDSFKYGQFSSLEELSAYMQSFKAKPTRKEKRDLRRGTKAMREKVRTRIENDTAILKEQFAVVVIDRK